MPTGKRWQALNAIDKRVAEEYRAASKAINDTILSYFDKYATNGRLAMADVAKRDRLKRLLVELDSQADALIKTRNGSLRTGLSRSFKDSFKRVARKLEKDAGQILGMKVPAAAEYVANNGELRATELVNAAKTKAEIRRTVLRSLNASKELDGVMVNGVPYREFANALKQSISKDYGRYVRVLRAEGTRINSLAENLVFTETQTPGMYSKQITLFDVPKPQDFIELQGAGGKAQTVRLYGGTKIQLGDAVEKIWVHDGPKVPRDSHLAADGQAADEDGFFTVGGIRVEAPGTFNDPAEDIGCLCSIDVRLKKVK